MKTYFSELMAESGSGWNRFWYAPSGSWHLSVLRHIVGLVAFVWLISYSPQLTDFFGEAGVYSKDSVHKTMTGGDLRESAPGFSHLFLISSNGGLWATHILCCLIALLAALGFFARVLTPITLLIVLCYIHRGPNITGLFEPLLCMQLLYLSLAPIDSLTRLRKGNDTEPDSWRATVATRLLQIHLCMFYLLIGCSKLGSPVWWTGDATWYLIQDAQHRLLGFTRLAESTYLLNAITHAWLLFELTFPILIWNRLLRPLMIVLSVFIWVWTAAVTGLVGYSLLMIAANFAFVRSATVNRWFGSGSASETYGSTQQSSVPAVLRA